MAPAPGFDPATDLFMSPHDFGGGKPPMVYSFKCEERLATWIYGAKTDVNTLSAGFRLDGPPTRDSYELILCAQDDDSEKKCRVRVLVNDNPMFEGENPFVRFGWSHHTFQVEGSLLKEGENSLKIKNIEDCNRRMGPPFFMLNYAVLKHARKLK